ncbi:BlaI/MecI/CopY family transcriptional regulator [Euryhalocaulis caribicus]|uniref:BlaI/MecI/CopY family transcriptional regulator n=1 Tax=Euryhalocaulis caribicus TaxID=1161401 RepID=UPI0019D6B919|nr:BlaI/MecI/CopY family transcriptional regulator [Euryhalocaulis caribicus]
MRAQLKLGKLELALLDFLWTEGSSDVKGAHQAVGRPRGISLNTVQSALERLFRKSLLGREKVSHAYCYKPCVSRAELASRMIGGVMEDLSGDDEALIAAFVDLASRTDEKTLERLEQALSARRAAFGERGDD